MSNLSLQLFKAKTNTNLLECALGKMGALKCKTTLSEYCGKKIYYLIPHDRNFEKLINSLIQQQQQHSQQRNLFLFVIISTQ
jgi:Mor family transcriptional regulator